MRILRIRIRFWIWIPNTGKQKVVTYISPTTAEKYTKEQERQVRMYRNKLEYEYVHL